MNTAALRKFAKLQFVKKKLKNKLKEIQNQIDKMEPAMLDHLADNEVDKVSLKGGTMLEVKTLIWAKCLSDKKSVIKAIRDAGEGWMIDEGYSAMTLSKYLRELNEQGKPLPKEFKGVIKANPVNNLIARKV
jgi:hypothetical protein